MSREFRFIQFVYTVRNISNRICKTKTKLEKKILEIGRRINHVLSNIQDLVISDVVLQPFVNNDKRNEQRIITHAYTTTVLQWNLDLTNLYLTKSSI